MRAKATRLLFTISRRAQQEAPGGGFTSWTCLACRSQQFSLQRTNRTFTSRPRYNDAHSSSKDSKPLTTPAATSTSLPSHIASRRSRLSKQLSQFTDSVLARASVAGQHINTYTGTDYSGIEALRKEVIEEEENVKTRHTAVGEAKSKHTEARTKQATSQKEIVALLERKSSWSPVDVERYMSLVRSEHLDDQAVHKAAEELAMAERELEDTRSLLEKLERKQYHEEQVWSDTIRRNSTWVTIGLMGVNILLLLAQISIFEPYRRRRIVKEVKAALDERVADSVQSTPSHDQLIVPEEIMQVSDEAAQPVVTLVEQINTARPVEDFPTIASWRVDDGLQALTHRIQAAVFGLFSDRAVQFKQVDVTSIALEGVAAGMAIAGVISLLILKASH